MMDRIELKIFFYDNEEVKLRAVTNKWKFQDATMGEQYLMLNVTSEKPIDWSIGDFCTFRGETFTLNYVPSVTQKAGSGERQDAYTYENIKFDSPQEELSRCEMLDITPTTGDYIAALGTNHTGSSKFQLFCGEVFANGRTLTAVCALAAKMQANLDRMFPQKRWQIFVDTTTTYTNSAGEEILVTHTEDKTLSFDGNTVADALAQVHDIFDLAYCTRGRNIYIGYNLGNLTGDDEKEIFVFGYGSGYPTPEDPNKALFQIKRVANSQQKIVTRLRALGSTKNLPYRYYNKAYAASSPDLSQTLFPTNLQLPDTFIPEGKETDEPGTNTKWGHNKQRDPFFRAVKGDTNDAYIDKNDDAEGCAEGVREASARWDGTDSNLPEIFPTIEEATYGELRSALVQDQSGRTGASAFPGYDSNERVDKLLAVGYLDDKTLVDDANKGDGILPESGISVSGVVRAASIGTEYLTYNKRDNGDFTYNGNHFAGKERTLFSIQGVSPGKYSMAPTVDSVFFNFHTTGSSIVGVHAYVGFILTVKQKNIQTGEVTTIATYTSDMLSASMQSRDIALPSLPDAVNQSNAQVKDITVSVLSDITVTITPILKDVSLTGRDSFTLRYRVGNTGNSTNYEPEYTWFPLDESDTLTDRFHVFVQDMGFDFEACWTDDTPVLAMKSGRCVGREFEIGSDIQKVTHNGKEGYMLTLKRATDSSLNTYYPSQTDPIAPGDLFVLLNISMPDAYVKMAEVRLLRAATQYLADNCETQFTYQPYVDDIYLQRNIDIMEKAGTPEKSIFWRLYAGLKFTFRGIPSSEDAPAPLIDITIEKVTISMGEGLTPKVELTLNDDIQQSTLQKLTTSVDRIYNGSLFSSGSGGSGGSNAAAVLSILQSEGEKLFLSKKHDDAADGKIEYKDVVTHKEVLKAKKGIKIGNFQSRFLGSGALIDEEGNAEFESIYSRNFISTPEFRFNRISVTEGEQWCTNGYGTIQEVEKIDETTGYITLKLEENDYASIAVGDICRGIYNDIAHEYETANLDDDSSLYSGSSEGEGYGFSAKAGFFTSYFWVKQMITNKKGECKFLYEIRNTKTPHPCEFMKFAQYGSFTNTERRSSSYSTSIGHFYEMVLDSVSSWKIRSANVVYRKGYLGNMTVLLKNGEEADLQGYGLYVQDNVYFGNAVVQLDPETLKDIEERLKSYSIDFSEYVNVITVDDAGNVIDGLYTVSGGYRKYRIQSAISVRRNNQPLMVAEDGKDADEGTYKIYFEPKGCTCMVENSTIYITSIDNIKDGVAGTDDDTNFDYDAMREMSECSVDLIIDCEGIGSIQKSFPIRIKHDSQPFISADITNEFSAVSWNTKTQSYIGLPIEFDMKMWRNDEILNIDNADQVSITPNISGVNIQKSIVTNSNGFKTARILITSLPADLPLVTNLNVTSAVIYAGVAYERTLVHTINKSTDTNVYSIIPSVSEVVVDNNDGAGKKLSTDRITCSIVCDSSDDKHYTVSETEYATHGIKLYYKTINTSGIESSWKIYSNYIPVSADLSEVHFILYGLNSDGTTDFNTIHDKESVPVITEGEDGVVYKLLPSLSAISFSYGEDGETLTPSSIQISCGYTKRTGAAEAKTFPGTVIANLWRDGGASYNIFYRLHNSNGSTGDWAWNKDLPNGTLSINASTTNIAVEFIMSSAAGWASIAEENIVDRVVVSITKDGESAKLYYLHSDVLSIIRNSDGTYKSNANPMITAWKKVGDNEAVCLHDTLNPDGMEIRAYEMKGTTKTQTYSSTNGFLACPKPYGDTDSFAVELVKNNKVYAALTIPIISEGEADFHPIKVTGLNYNCDGVPSLLVDGTNIMSSHDFKRGVTMAILNMENLAIIYAKTYDVYGDWEEGKTEYTNELLSDIRKNATEGRLVVFLSSDAIYIHDRVWAKLGCEYGVGQNIATPIAQRYSLAIICQKGMKAGQAVVSMTGTGIPAIANASVASKALIIPSTDIIPVGANILQQTNFESFSRWKTHNGSVIEGDLDGCNGFVCTANNYNILEQVVSEVSSGPLKNGTWYTLSFYAKGESITTYIYPAGVDSREKCYVDGKEQDLGGDAMWAWNNIDADKYGLHSFTFKTRPKCVYRGSYSPITKYNWNDIVTNWNGSEYDCYLSQTDDNLNNALTNTAYWIKADVDINNASAAKYGKKVNVLWRKLSGTGTTYVAKLKLEEGITPTGWQTSNDDRIGPSGCRERLFEIFTPGMVYYNEEGDTKKDIRYVDFYAKEDSTMASGYKVYMCKETHVAAATFNEDLSYWSEVSVNAASAFFTYLIAKNANIKILSSAQITVAETNGNVVAGLANTNIPLWVGGKPEDAPFRVTRQGQLFATGATIEGNLNVAGETFKIFCGTNEKNALLEGKDGAGKSLFAITVGYDRNENYGSKIYLGGFDHPSFISKYMMHLGWDNVNSSFVNAYLASQVTAGINVGAQNASISMYSSFGTATINSISWPKSRNDASNGDMYLDGETVKVKRVTF